MKCHDRVTSAPQDFTCPPAFTKINRAWDHKSQWPSSTLVTAYSKGVVPPGPSSPPGIYRFLGLFLTGREVVPVCFECIPVLTQAALSTEVFLLSASLDSPWWENSEAVLASNDTQGCCQPPRTPSCVSGWDANFKPESLFSQEIETPHVKPGLFKITQSPLIAHSWGSAIFKGRPRHFWAPRPSEPSRASIIRCFLLLFVLRSFSLSLFELLRENRWLFSLKELGQKLETRQHQSQLETLYCPCSLNKGTVRKTSPAGKQLPQAMSQTSHNAGLWTHSRVQCYTANSVRTLI